MKRRPVVLIAAKQLPSQRFVWSQCALFAIRLVGFLGLYQIPSRSLMLSCRGTLVRGDIAEALLDSEFLDFGSPLMSGGRFIVTHSQPTVSVLVTPMGACRVLGGVSGVFAGHRLLRGELFLPAKEFVGPLGGFVAR